MLEDALLGMLAAVRAEKVAVRAQLGLPREAPTVVPARDGRRRLAEPGAYLYRFRCELPVRLPEGTRLQVRLHGGGSSGEVTRHDVDDDRLECSLRDDLGAEVPQATFQLDPTHLLDSLETTLEGLLEEPTGNEPLAVAFLSGRAAPPSPAPAVAPGLSAAQRACVSFALGASVAYLWGPPGTGKTRTVGALVRELVARGERVLLSAHTNVATDEALARVLAAGDWPRGSAIRVGPPGPTLRGRVVGLEEVVDAELRERAPALVVELEDCIELAHDLGLDLGGAREALLPRRLRALVAVLRDHDDAAELAARVAALDGRVALLERDVLLAARVVATTLTRLYVSTALGGLEFDAAIVDEASIAPLPLCLLAALAAKRRVVGVGDFMQLPAIAVSEEESARRWLGTNVFESAACADPARDHPLRVMLDEQWRMHPSISSVVSRHFYAGRLRDAAARRAEASAIVIVDTSGAGAFSERAGGSKRNPLHADLIAELVSRAAPLDTGVTAPYRAQVRLLRERIREAVPGALESGRVEAFTTHRFQGREKSLMIFDVTDAPGTRIAFLDERRNPAAPNLVNVAISRARDRLVIVADLEHLSGLGRDHLLARILATMRAEGATELEWGNPADRAELARLVLEWTRGSPDDARGR